MRTALIRLFAPRPAAPGSAAYLRDAQEGGSRAGHPAGLVRPVALLLIRVGLILAVGVVAGLVALAISIFSAQAGEPVDPDGPQICSLRDAVIAAIGKKNGEVLAWSGKAGEHELLELLVSPRGTWSIIATGADGMSCVLGGGESSDWKLPALRGRPS
jgi:hypothetical protein